MKRLKNLAVNLGEGVIQFIILIIICILAPVILCYMLLDVYSSDNPEEAWQIYGIQGNGAITAMFLILCTLFEVLILLTALEG